MKLERIKIGNKEVMPFTIPSGIVTTEPSCLERMALDIPELGILTTKSIGPEPRTGNREPILAQYLPGGFVNAVGLTNPGVEEFAKKLSQINIPEDKFLLASIFGKTHEEFVYVAKTLEDSVDGFELNLSCPHAKGYGMQLGQDPQIVREITEHVVRSLKSGKPVFAKLTPNAGNIGEIAKAAMQGGAYGIVAINTVGPGYYSFDGNPVLTNKVGGMSGRGVTPIGIKCVRDIRQALGEAVPIIGMGGIACSQDVVEYKNAGANAFGIGSALAGMTQEEIANYFSFLREDLFSENFTSSNLDSASMLLKEVRMNYRRVSLDSITNNGCDFKVFKTRSPVQARPGQFVFAWLPGVGEKPFSVMDDDPLTLGILERGEFTRKFNQLSPGAQFYIRGPYGQAPEIEKGKELVLVGGGCGIAGIYHFAKHYSNTNKVITLLGARDANHLPYLKEFTKYSNAVAIATEDGSLGRKGLVTDILKDLKFNDAYFVNCGPKSMVNAVLPLELKHAHNSRVYSSVDYMTRCGVGICGSCADKEGRRTCVEGPFTNPASYLG